MSQKVNIRNKKAGFEYHLEDVFVAGIMLTGGETKSIRASKASINEAYCYIKGGEIFIRNMHIAEYEPASYNNHEPKRERKLLLNKREIEKIEKELKVQGTTLIPLELFFSDRGYAKLKIALARGKKLFDKREDIKKKDTSRELDRIKKERR